MRKILFSLLFLFSGLVFSQTKPIAADVSAAHFKDTNGLIHLVGSDAEFHALTYTIVTLPTHGTLKDPNNSDAVISAGGSLTGNSVTFVPHSDENHKYIFSGTNSFTYKVTDSDGDSDIKTVSVEVFDAYLNPPTEIGSEINGEAPGDNFGRAVSLSEDGTIMAVGAPFNDAGSTDSDKGSVRVYQFTVGSGWSKLGDDIDGTTDQDYFGSSVSLNGDGTILAVGIPYNDTANSNAGQVKVYQYNSGTTTWDLMSTITPNIVASGSNKAVSEQFGNDVRLSSDGKTLAVSDIWFDRSGGNNSGRVVVYRYDGTSWNSLGNETALYGESGDNLSWGLSLSANGNIMAVGAHDYSSNNKGQVKIFEYDSANTEWDVKATLLGDKSAEKFGAAVDLSSDGLIVAVGAPYHRVAGSGSEFVGKVSIYKWDGSTYSALGSDLIGSDKYDYFGAHLSLDNEGNTLAVMGPGHDANSGSSSGNYLNKGRVRVYNYDTASTSWVQSPASYDFDGEEDEDQSTGSNNESKGQRVFLSGNGSVLAIGADENDGNGTNSGHVRVYELFQPQIIPVADSQDVSFLLYEQVTSDEITLKGTDSDGDDANLVYIITELNTAKLFEGSTEITSSDIPHTLTANKVKYNSNSDVLVNDSFKFIVHDTKASSGPARVNLTIIPDNDPPVATGQSLTSDEDVAKDIDLAGTDVDNADTNLNFLIYSLPVNGTLTDKNNGNSAVTLVTKDSGTTTSANTDKLEDSSQNFTSTVVPGDFLINTTDNTYADIKAVDSDTVLSLSADIMASGEEYTIKRGTSLVVSSGTAKVTYTPNSNFVGSDSFKFKARDKGVGDDELTDVENSIDTATVSLTVNNTDNDPPVAEDQTLSTDEEKETGTITLVAVDPDPGDTNLTYTIAVLPTNGKLKDGGTEITAAGDISGALTYLPNANFSGNDTFKFTAKDDESTPAVSNQATVTINVGNLNDAPLATAQSVTVDEDTENDITHAGTDPDGDSLTYIIITLPSKGILKDNGTEIVSGDLPKTLSSTKATYVPQTNYNGADSYTFKVNDGTVDSTLAATVDITVKEVNDPPIANSQSLTTDEDTALTIKFTGSDIENDPLTYLIKTLPTNGKLKDGNTEILASELPKLLPADEITYMPNADYIGDDSFDFLINANYLNSFTKANNLKYITQNGVPVTYQKPEGKTYFLIQENTGVSGTPIDWTTARTLTNSIKGAKMYVILDATMELLVWNGLKSMGLTGKSGLYYWIGLYQDTNSPDYAEPGLETQNWGGWTWVDGVTLKDRGYENWYNYPSEPNNAGAEHYAQFEFSSTGPKGIQWNDMSIGNAQSWPLFEFSISSSTQSVPAKISIRVESVNDPPVANAQTVNINEDTIDASITLTGTDPESQPLTYTVTALPNKGILKESGTAIATVPKILAGDALTYSPNADYNGNDALTFEVNDGVNNSANAIVSIVVIPVNDPPESDPQTVNTDEDVAVDITHVGRDKDLVDVFTVHTQMGSDIPQTGQIGESLALSSNGKRIILGEWRPGSGNAKVFDWDGTSWKQAGSNIDGSSSGDLFGENVTISSDGDRIAIAGPNHDGNKGHVRVFDWDGTSWTQSGAPIQGDSAGDKLGFRGLHLSGDGKVLAIASFKGGYINTYKWNGTEWIKSAVIPINIGTTESPGQVYLSMDGNRLAIGSIANGSKGQVKIFDWDGTNTWTQYVAIDGNNGRFGNAIDLTRDGKKIAIGEHDSSSVSVYDISGSNLVKIGGDIPYGNQSSFWRYISLSDDGSRLGIPIMGTKLGVFDWDGTSWKQLGADIISTGLTGESFDMSSDGKIIAGGGHSGPNKIFNVLNLTYIITSLPSNGILKEGTKTITASDLPFTLKGTDATYVPNTGFSGEDKYNFKVNDGRLDSTNSLNGKREDSQVTIKIKEFVLNLPLSNYTITPTETCKGFAFGIIDIEVAATSYKKTAAGADIPITYNIAIEGKGQVATIVSPAKTAQIKDLAEGTHKLVFTVVGQPKYEQKIDVQIIGTDPPVAYTVGKIENCDDDADGDDTNGKVNFDTSSILDKLLKNPSTGALQDKNLFDFEFTYYDDATSGNVTKATLPNPLYSASQTVSVKFKSKINGKCEANQTIDFVVNTLPEIKRIEDTKSVCTNLPPATIGVTNADNRKYTYTWTRNGTNFPLNITGIDSSILIGLGGEYIVTATTTDGTNCSKSMKITIKESSIATLLRTDIVIKDLLAGPNNTITIKTATLGIGDYEYALDDQTGPYQDEPVFNKVRPGKHTVYVRDKNGCGVVNMDVWVIGYKKFFTPNGDGYTDKWNIIGITKDYQARSKIYIFDRFEKLLKELDPLTPGWDGNFNGKPMPQTDYWFKVILEDGRMFKGHFSLIRAW